MCFPSERKDFSFQVSRWGSRFSESEFPDFEFLNLKQTLFFLNKKSLTAVDWRCWLLKTFLLTKKDVATEADDLFLSDDDFDGCGVTWVPVPIMERVRFAVEKIHWCFLTTELTISSLTNYHSRWKVFTHERRQSVDTRDLMWWQPDWKLTLSQVINEDNDSLDLESQLIILGKEESIIIIIISLSRQLQQVKKNDDVVVAKGKVGLVVSQTRMKLWHRLNNSTSKRECSSIQKDESEWTDKCILLQKTSAQTLYSRIQNLTFRFSCPWLKKERDPYTNSIHTTLFNLSCKCWYCILEL